MGLILLSCFGQIACGQPIEEVCGFGIAFGAYHISVCRTIYEIIKVL